MKRYLEQLHEKIELITETIVHPREYGERDYLDWISDTDEDRTSPRRDLEEYLGLLKIELPPASKLSNEQIKDLLGALKKLLDKINWSFVMVIEVPERVQYETVRDNFSQEIILKSWNMGFFTLCSEGSEHRKCALGEYCHCAFYDEWLSQYPQEDLSPEEERRRQLEIEVNHLKRKHGRRWMRYYPYHLDPDCDDDDSNPCDFGFDDDDEWWKR